MVVRLRNALLVLLLSFTSIEINASEKHYTNSIEARILMTALEMSNRKIKYKYGGNSVITGLDCSSFISHVFASSIGLSLPRTSLEISSIGEKVALENINASDIVFYKTTIQHFSHVGIYIGNNQFIHASQKHGKIRISDMKSLYWKHRFDGARRLIPAKSIVS